MTVYIGTAGRARHGKTSVCLAIQDEATIAGFDAKIYDIGAEILAYCIEQGRILPKKREELTSEELIILIEAGREFRAQDNFFWLNRINQRILRDVPDIALIPNLRYPFEGDWLRAQNGHGHVIKCVRLNRDGSMFYSPDRPSHDESERSADTFNADYFITVREGDQALRHELAITIWYHIVALENLHAI